MPIEGWWYEGAGIYRHVRLYAKDSLHIAHNGIWANPILRKGTDDVWDVELETELENSAYEAACGKVTAVLYDGEKIFAESQSDSVVCRENGRQTVRQILTVNAPERWDVDHPKLYRLCVRAEGKHTCDEENVRIGFRTFSVDAEHGFFLNGRPLKLKGACCHQDHAGVGVALPDSVQRFRVEQLKRMGCNAYRSAHNLPAKEILDACDELGLIVMDENRRFETRAEVLEDLRVMVKRDRNHPSVLFWSLFNEEPLQNTGEGARIYRRMRAQVEKYDRTRLITGAINGTMDGAGLEMDVTGLNYNLPYLDAIHALYPEQPIIGTENDSALATRGCFQNNPDAHTIADTDEEAVPWGLSVRKTWAFARERDWYCGIFIWTGFDYRGEPTPYTWPSVTAQFGVMDLCGFEKEAFWFVRACFSAEPTVHLLPHWNWHEGEMVRVCAPTNCDAVELFLNGRSLGKQTGDACRTPTWEVPFERGVLQARAYRDEVCVATDERRSAGEPFAIRVETDRTVYRNDGADTAILNFSVVDWDGVMIPTATDLLRFDVSEGGTIRGVENGDPNSHESEVLPQRHLFAGRCQLLVTVGRGATEVTVRANADGLQPAELHLSVQSVESSPEILEARCAHIGGFTMSGVTEERPDPLVHIAEDDMNSFIPVRFEPDSFQNDFRHGWRIYRATVRMPKGRHCSLEFPSLIADEMEIYFNGVCVHRLDVPFNGQKSQQVYRCSFENTFGDTANLRILIRVDHAMYGGISKGIQIFGEF